VRGRGVGFAVGWGGVGLGRAESRGGVFGVSGFASAV
jgi:hypothetical protein